MAIRQALRRQEACGVNVGGSEAELLDACEQPVTQSVHRILLESQLGCGVGSCGIIRGGTWFGPRDFLKSVLVGNYRGVDLSPRGGMQWF